MKKVFLINLLLLLCMLFLISCSNDNNTSTSKYNQIEKNWQNNGTNGDNNKPIEENPLDKFVGKHILTNYRVSYTLNELPLSSNNCSLYRSLFNEGQEVFCDDDSQPTKNDFINILKNENNIIHSRYIFLLINSFRLFAQGSEKTVMHG